MLCPSCSTDNPLGAKFCNECATPLPLQCPSCGTENPSSAKFCNECATPLTPQSKVQGPESEVSKSPILGPQSQAEAEEYFLKAITIARKQQAKSLELRATMSLARLWQQSDRTAEDHQMLSEVYNWFTEGFDMKDLQEAKALLEELKR